MRSSAGRGSLVLALICGAIRIHAAQVIIVLRPGGTGWQVVEAEKITFNQKDTLRIGPSQPLAFSRGAYNKFPNKDKIVGVGTLRRHAGGYLVRRVESVWVPVAADGDKGKTDTSYAAVWSAAAVAYQAQEKAKTFTPLRADEIYAIVPGKDPSEALANLIAADQNFQGLGEGSADAVFTERMSLLLAVANSVTGQGETKLQQLLLTAMLDVARKTDAGIAKHDDLLLGLKYADVSAQAYPKDAALAKARSALRETKAKLDRLMAILKTFRAGELWDAYLDKYDAFERWDNAFQDLRKSREQAFQESGNQHRDSGKKYLTTKNYASALEELTIAQRRLPADGEIAGLVEKTKLDLEIVNATAKRTAEEVVGSTNYRLITRRVQNADNCIKDGKDAEKKGRDLEAEGKSLKTAGRLTEAETKLEEAARKLEEAEAKFREAEVEILQAEGVNKDSPPPRIMLYRAKLLQARKKPLEALAILDKYARQVADDEGKGDELRNDIAYELKSTKEIKKAAVAKALADGDYSAALSTVQEGLALDPNDLDLLYHAGRIHTILRKYADAADRFKKYLSLSQTPGANQTRRAEVLNDQALLKPPDPEPEGKPNWFSAYRNPPGIAYCPISLMPNAHVVDVKASRKLTTTFQWTGDQLLSVQNTSLEAGEGRSAVYFDYFKDRGGVRRVSVDPLEDAAAELPTPRFTAAGTVGTGKGTYLGLPNHPVVDPLMVERLTGKRVATIVSGNPYFHPFVWNGIYVFIAEYDDRGRVKSARQIPAAGQASRTLDFKWDGDSLRLIEIVERGGVYRRTMTYSGNKLMSETVAFGGRSSKIEYKYKGDQLLEANCGDDVSLDNRSRHVTFR